MGRAASEEKARASSLYLLFYYMGSSVIGALGGIFLHWDGWQGEVMMLAVVLLVALLVSVWLCQTEDTGELAGQKNL
ncbi:MAG TPA: hypothetical protein VN611_00075 [Patescibacteria group bacterium]|nr:hypothetical protein [Patescibacteria group bacterium]